MIAAPPPAEPQFLTISAIVFPAEDGNLHFDVPGLSTPGQMVPACGALPQLVADGKMSAPIEVSSAHSTTNAQPRGAIPDQFIGIGIGQDSRPTLPPQHPLLQSLLRVSFTLFNAL